MKPGHSGLSTRCSTSARRRRKTGRPPETLSERPHGIFAIAGSGNRGLGGLIAGRLVREPKDDEMTKLSGGDSKSTLYCSFCGKSQHEVRKLIAGPTVFICDECVELCNDIIREETKSALVKTRDGVATPAEICQGLGDYVIGQDAAPQVLAHAGHNHYKRLNHATKNNDVELAKSNIM